MCMPFQVISFLQFTFFNCKAPLPSDTRIAMNVSVLNADYWVCFVLQGCWEKCMGDDHCLGWFWCGSHTGCRYASAATLDFQACRLQYDTFVPIPLRTDLKNELTSFSYGFRKGNRSSSLFTIGQWRLCVSKAKQSLTTASPNCPYQFLALVLMLLRYCALLSRQIGLPVLRRHGLRRSTWTLHNQIWRE